MTTTEILNQLVIQEGNLKAGRDFGAKPDFITATIRKINELQKALETANGITVLAF